MALASSEGWLFLLRWIHLFAGVIWIGLLYYFNFVQTPFFAETEAPVRGGAIQKLVPRALWWFRYGALFTFLSGAPDHPPPMGSGRVLRRLVRLGDPAGRPARHADVPERLGGDLAQPEGGHPERHRYGRGTPREPGRRRRRRAGRTRVTDEHAALDPDAVLHGRREPPHTAGTAQWTRVLGRRTRHPAGRRDQRPQGHPWPGRGEAARDGEGHASGRASSSPSSTTRGSRRCASRPESDPAPLAVGPGPSRARHASSRIGSGPHHRSAPRPASGAPYRR